MKTCTALLAVLVLLVLAPACLPASVPHQVATGVAATLTALALPSSSTTPAPPLPSAPTPAGTSILPYPDAPLCPDTGEAHDDSLFHTLWDDKRGCHYDHEHGENPFSPEVAAVFPGFDLFALLGHVQIGHTNPSSPMENTMKHGGFKWQVDVPAPRPCYTGFEGAQYGLDSAVIQYHSFGDYSLEFETNIHSSAVLARECVPGSSDYGYVYTVALQDYGQRLFNYQGMLMPYSNNPVPSYPTGLGPYFASQCVFCGAKLDSREAILARGGHVASIWTSKGEQVMQQSIFNLLFRIRDPYQVVDQRDQTYPFTFVWLCSSDSGLTYDGTSCRFNNSATHVQEVRIIIPSGWDNLRGVDSDLRAGRITADGFVDRKGDWNSACSAPSSSCFPIKLASAYVGNGAAELSRSKVTFPTPHDAPERDIYFCGTQVCSEEDPGAMPSGWLGPGN